VTSVEDAAVWNAISRSGAYHLIYRVREQFRPHYFFQIWQLGRGKHFRAPGSSALTATARAADTTELYPVLALETWITVAFGCLVAAGTFAIRLWWRRGKGLEDV
jgi:hypothetical protein